jgi:hypothetical protein
MPIAYFNESSKKNAAPSKSFAVSHETVTQPFLTRTGSSAKRSPLKSSA